MALMNDDLRKLADAIAVGRRTVRIIQFNVGFAIAVKVIFLVLAFTGHTGLWLAILADTGATLMVIANATRLLRS
jgi:Cd2+/Zn2+-exporting ATPase